MALKNLSLAGSLCFVALGLFANAGVDWASATQKTVYADDLKEKAPRRMPEGGMRPAMDKTPPTIPAGSGGGGCIEGEPINWFGAIHELPECAAVIPPSGNPQSQWAYFPVDEGRLVDVNGDGRVEAFRKKAESAGNFNVPLMRDGLPEADECVLMFQVADEEAGSVAFVEHCVFSSADIVPFLLQQPWAAMVSYAYGDAMGWRDLDNDSDLDLVFRIQYASPSSGSGYKAYWLENTGYEATQPLVGDLDGDGSVSASDLTILLGGWTS
jgi:hypothetical protein